MKYIRQRNNGTYQVRIYSGENRLSFTSNNLDEVIKRRNEELGYDPDVYVESNTSNERVLLIDIETTPVLAYVWGLWNQNISIERIKDDWHLLCFAYKWLDKDAVRFASIDNIDPPEVMSREEALVFYLWELLNEADVVVAHNGDKFDIKMINTKFLEYGFTQPSPYRSVDTLKLAKRKFRITSNKLDYLSQYLGGTGKEKHHGNHFDLWLGCMNGDKTSWKQMEKYNVVDVLELERIYKKLRVWNSHPPLFSNTEKPQCTLCGSYDMSSIKPYKTNLSTYLTYRCENCGNIVRSTSRKRANSVIGVV